MKKLITTLVLLAFGIISAQDFQGIAYYTSKTKMKNVKISSPDMTPAMQEQLNEKLKKGFEKEHILNFTKTESVFQEEEKLEIDSGDANTKMMFSSGKPTKLYKDIKNKTFVEEKDFFSKEFLIADSLKTEKWEFVNETKTIGNYTCYKAQLTIPVNEEQLKKYREAKEKVTSSENTFMMMAEPKGKIIEAWYTLDIPVSNGPAEYWGLPGLILEIHTDKISYLCNKIVLNPKNKVVIKKPTKGKKVTQTEFKDIVSKKLSEMQGGGKNNAIEIRMN